MRPVSIRSRESIRLQYNTTQFIDLRRRNSLLVRLQDRDAGLVYRPPRISGRPELDQFGLVASQDSVLIMNVLCDGSQSSDWNNAVMYPETANRYIFWATRYKGSFNSLRSAAKSDVLRTSELQ